MHVIAPLPSYIGTLFSGRLWWYYVADWAGGGREKPSSANLSSEFVAVIDEFPVNLFCCGFD